MPKKCKDLYNYSMVGIPDDVTLNQSEQEFCSVKRTLEDFKLGLKVPSKLMPRRIKGGIVLTETTYEMR